LHAEFDQQTFKSFYLVLCACSDPNQPPTYLDLLLLVVFAAAEGQDAQEQLHPWKVAESRL
jgi:hypothetical protein